MEKICIGIVTKPQALKGAFRIKPCIDNFKCIKKIKQLQIGNQEYLVEEVSIRDTFVILKVQGIDSCESAETLRNCQVFADIEKSQNVFENYNYVGYLVVANGTNGKIVEINNYGAKDIISISSDRNYMVPVIDGLINRIDNDKKIIEFNNEIFEQVVVYED